MNKIYLKIIALFFLSILLTSNILNLHVFFNDHDTHCLTQYSEYDEENEDTPCELCVLVLNLNNLDYNNSATFSFESDTQIIAYHRKEVSTYKAVYRDRLFSDHNRNKAPPYLI